MVAVLVLQARMTSTRLPGKVLRKVGGRSILEWVVRGGERIPGIDCVCVAVPVGSAHEPVAEEAGRLGAVVVRGPEQDVLERFRLAAETTGATEIMRVTTDCPMMDPVLCGEVLALRRSSGVDYACNNMPFTFPHGLDCEFFTRMALDRAAATATEDYDREHVTPWIRRNPSISRINLEGPADDSATWRWTVDYEEDFRFFEAVVAALGDEVNNWHRMAAHLRAHPELHEINRDKRQR